MLRLLVSVIWIYLVYRTLRWAFIALGVAPDRNSLGPDPDSPTVNQMVKDPVCGTYVLARDAKHVRIKGKTYYFCSDDCLNRFVSK
ncbi:MAG: YHS domain-containing protein [Desulfomonilaceae bacterium]